MTVKLEIGLSTSIEKHVTALDVEAYAHMTGDTNPIHLDDVYASQSRFGRRIAHGLLVAGYISAVLGNLLPGPGSIYVSQQLSFKAPVYLGDTITVRVTVKEIRLDKPIATLSTQCFNQSDQIVIDGEAVLLYPQEG